MDSVSVTVAIIVDRYIENLEYSINMVMAQNYENFDFIVLVEEYKGVDLGKIIEIVINSKYNNRNNFRLLTIKNNSSLMLKAKKILENSDSEYFIFLYNEDYFYDQHSIENIISSPEYMTCFGRQYLVNSIKNNNSIPFLNNPAIIRISYLEESLNISDTKKIKADISKVKMNFTSFQKLETLNKNKSINSINYVIESIKYKSKGGFWEIPKGQLVFYDYLIKLKKAIIKNKKTSKLINKERDNSEEKIKIVFFTQEYNLWPTFMSVYERALFDERFEPELVFIPFNHHNKINSDEEIKKEIDHYRDSGYSIKAFNEYDLSKHNPDIAFFMKAYDELIPNAFTSSMVSKVVDRIIFLRYAPYGMNPNNTPFEIKTVYRSPINYLAWKNLISSKAMYRGAKELSYKKGENYLGIGSPRIDITEENIKGEYKNILEGFKARANRRKIFFLNSQHSIENNNIESRGTFLDYGEDILDIFINDPSIFLIWRPHPLFFIAAEKMYKSLGKDIDELCKKIDLVENIIIDKSLSYLPAMIASDALITDLSSLLTEYIITQKPIMLLKKKDNLPIYPEEYDRCLFTACNIFDIKKFVNMVKMDKDEMRNIRREFCEKYFFLPEEGKTVAQEILDYIYVNILKEEGDLALGN